MTNEEKKGVASVITLYGLIGALIFRAEFMTVLEMALPFLPLVAYGVVGLVIRRSLQQPIPSDAKQTEFDRQQTASLTMTGFCFTSLSLLVSFFKDDLKVGNQQAIDIVFVFSCALIAFIASYTVLRFRIRRVADYLSDGFLDSGLWCILVGLHNFFALNRPSKVSYLFAGILCVFAFFVLRSLSYYVRFSDHHPVAQQEGQRPAAAE